MISRYSITGSLNSIPHYTYNDALFNDAPVLITVWCAIIPSASLQWDDTNIHNMYIKNCCTWPVFSVALQTMDHYITNTTWCVPYWSITQRLVWIDRGSHIETLQYTGRPYLVQYNISLCVGGSKETTWHLHRAILNITWESGHTINDSDIWKFLIIIVNSRWHKM